jgi:hypothetical protein
MSLVRLLLFVVFLLASSFSAPVFAQEAEPLKTDVIWQRERLDVEIAELQRSYQGQLEEYLYKDKLFRIAYDQYKELQTLAAIEDMVIKGRELGLIRGQVLLSYLNLLRLKLIATEGIEIALKEHYLNRLETTLAYITDHQQVLTAATDRDRLSQALTQFSLDQRQVGNLANEVLVLLSVGNLQMIHDKSIVLKRDVDSYLLEQGKTEIANVERASNETDRSLSSAKMKLDALWNNVLRRGSDNFNLTGIYGDLPRTLNPIYVNLSQSISYLGELLSF